MGGDLASPQGQQARVEVIKQAEPTLVMVGFPCTCYCVFNVKLNNTGREHLLLARQEAMAPLLRLMVQTFEEQADKGRYYLLENPASSVFWVQPELQPLWKRKDACSSVGNLCAYNKRSSKGGLQYKPMRWLGNNGKLVASVTRVCPGGHQHEPVFGDETRKSQVYPDELSRSVLQVLAGLVKDQEARAFQRAAGSVSVPAPLGAQESFFNEAEIFMLDDPVEEFAHEERYRLQARKRAETAEEAPGDDDSVPAFDGKSV